MYTKYSFQQMVPEPNNSKLFSMFRSPKSRHQPQAHNSPGQVGEHQQVDQVLRPLGPDGEQEGLNQPVATASPHIYWKTATTFGWYKSY